VQKVLFLCTGNSCRSIMAEALLNALGAGRYEAASAGSSPAGYVHPGSIATLKRHGIDPGTPRSKSWEEFAGRNFDLVVTLCDDAAGDSCPIFAGKAERRHWSIPDPGRTTGTTVEFETAFDTAFALLKRKIETLIQ
jgi:arsenate reductase